MAAIAHGRLCQWYPCRRPLGKTTCQCRVPLSANAALLLCCSPAERQEDAVFSHNQPRIEVKPPPKPEYRTNPLDKCPIRSMTADSKDATMNRGTKGEGGQAQEGGWWLAVVTGVHCCQHCYQYKCSITVSVLLIVLVVIILHCSAWVVPKHLIEEVVFNNKNR